MRGVFSQGDKFGRASIIALSTGVMRGRRSVRGVAIVVGAAVLSVPAVMLLGHDGPIRSAFAAMGADPAALMAARSPGARAPGALTQTKLRRVKPTERVLGQQRTRPAKTQAATVFPEIPAEAFTDATPAVTSVDVFDPPAFGSIGNAPGPGLVAIGGGGGVVGGGGTGGGGGGVTPPTNPTTPTVSAVPEPSTWLTTIVGFFAAGMGLRLRRSAAVRRGRVVA